MSGPNTEKPTQIAGYHLRAEIARGGMGAVYRAYQISMDRVVAVKVLAAQFTEDAVFVERFLKEARAAARLNHPNIVQAIDVAQSDGRYYFVMEFVEGSTLSALLRERGKLPPLEACGLVVQIARGLEQASRFGMLHLDVKPGNIMVTPAGCAKLADFGLARHMTDEDTIYAQKKVIFGTPHYMSPE
jgi:serine/threonine-protein kinase